LSAAASPAAGPVEAPRSSERERTPDLPAIRTQQQPEVTQQPATESRALPPQSDLVVPEKAPDSTASSKQPSTAEPAGPTGWQPTVLTNSDILYLVKAHISTEVITDLIQSSRPNFETTPAALAALKAANVPEAVILAMSEASRSKFPQ
jgi:hypothetical protein